MSDLKPCTCPKCGGSGFLPDLNMSSGGVTCHACCGQGILYPTGWLAAPAPDDELARLEHTLSEWFCDEILENMQLRGLLTSTEKWSDISEYVSGMRAKFLQWMELTGRIERHPDNPNLVRLREKDNE